MRHAGRGESVRVDAASRVAHVDAARQYQVGVRVHEMQQAIGAAAAAACRRRRVDRRCWRGDHQSSLVDHIVVVGGGGVGFSRRRGVAWQNEIVILHSEIFDGLFVALADFFTVVGGLLLLLNVVGAWISAAVAAAGASVVVVAAADERVVGAGRLALQTIVVAGDVLCRAVEAVVRRRRRSVKSGRWQRERQIAARHRRATAFQVSRNVHSLHARLVTAVALVLPALGQHLDEHIHIAVLEYETDHDADDEHDEADEDGEHEQRHRPAR